MGSVVIGANSYNIYGTEAGADVYLAARIGATAWTDASSNTRRQALVTGTRLIQSYLAAQGHDVDPASAVDVAIENANYELSFALVVDPTIQDAVNQGNNQKRVKAGSAEVEYFRPVAGGRFPTIVQALLNGWLSEQGAAYSSAPFASGTCERSTLCEDDYGLTEGY